MEIKQYFVQMSLPVELLAILLCGLILWWLTKWGISRIVKGMLSNRGKRVTEIANPIVNQERLEQRAKTIGSVLKSISATVILTLMVWYFCEALHLPVAPLFASISVAGIAIGFGTQQLVRDFISGLFITFEDQYGIGDIVEISDISGRVLDVGLRTTKIVDDEGTIWYLRNGEMFKIGNRSQGNYQPKPKEDDNGDQKKKRSGDEG